MSAFFFTPQAQKDLDDVWLFIAADSDHHADMVEEAIYATCRLAAASPGLGRRRPGLSEQDVLFLTVAAYKKYLIAYEAGTEPLRVVGVLHGARDVWRLALRLS